MHYQVDYLTWMDQYLMLCFCTMAMVLIFAGTTQSVAGTASGATLTSIAWSCFNAWA